jgi:hypothetical protein
MKSTILKGKTVTIAVDTSTMPRSIAIVQKVRCKSGEARR